MFSREMDPNQGRSGRVVPRLEKLEDRCCPSGMSLQNHVLTLTGSANASSAIVLQDDGHGDVTVKINGHSVTENAVQTININSEGGSDTINYSLLNPLTANETLNLKLGNSQDNVNLDFSKGVSAHSLKIMLDGGAGDQNISAEFGSITNTDLQLAASLGNGWDHFSAQFNGNLAGAANVGVNVKGGQSADGESVQIKGDIASTAQMIVDEALGQMGGSVRADYTGKLSGKLSILGDGGPLGDFMRSSIDLTKGSTGSLYDHMLGGAGSDLLMLMVNSQGSALKSLDALIDGGLGLNTALNTPNVKVLNANH